MQCPNSRGNSPPRASDYQILVGSALALLRWATLRVGEPQSFRRCAPESQLLDRCRSAALTSSAKGVSYITKAHNAGDSVDSTAHSLGLAAEVLAARRSYRVYANAAIIG